MSDTGRPTVFGIDPGAHHSGWCWLDPDGKPLKWGWDENRAVAVDARRCATRQVVIEDISHYGMRVGKDVFETLKWIGRFDPDETAVCIPRSEVLLTLCGKRQGANDAAVRQALIDLYGGMEKALGGKRCPTCHGIGLRGRGKARGACPDCPDRVADAHYGTRGTGYMTPFGPLHGITAHVWSALAVAAVYRMQEGAPRP